jgi:hypothetical protein
MQDELSENIYLTEKYISDEDIQQHSGKYFSLDNDWTQITIATTRETNTIVIYKPNNQGILAILYKNAISAHLCKLATEKYTKAGKIISTNSGNAAGSKHRSVNTNSIHRYEKGVASNSNIIGYIDSSNHKRPCPFNII